MKGKLKMDGKGSFIAQVYTSNAQLPIKDAVVTITTPEEEKPTVLFVRNTDSSGRTKLVELDSPPMANSLTPDNGTEAFSSYFVRIDHPKFETALIKDVQIFSNETTIQPTELIPLPETTKRGDKIDIVLITPQNL